MRRLLPLLTLGLLTPLVALASPPESVPGSVLPPAVRPDAATWLDYGAPDYETAARRGWAQRGGDGIDITPLRYPTLDDVTSPQVTQAFAWFSRAGGEFHHLGGLPYVAGWENYEPGEQFDPDGNPATPQYVEHGRDLTIEFVMARLFDSAPAGSNVLVTVQGFVEDGKHDHYDDGETIDPDREETFSDFDEGDLTRSFYRAAFRGTYVAFLGQHSETQAHMGIHYDLRFFLVVTSMILDGRWPFYYGPLIRPDAIAVLLDMVANGEPFVAPGGGLLQGRIMRSPHARSDLLPDNTHNKFALFSELAAPGLTGTDYVFQTSANFNGDTRWSINRGQDAVLIRDTELYAAYRRYFRTLYYVSSELLSNNDGGYLFDAPLSDFEPQFRSSDGSIYAWFGPKNMGGTAWGVNRRSDDPVLAVLDSIVITNGQVEGACTVRLALSEWGQAIKRDKGDPTEHWVPWSAGRARLTKLNELVAAGCEVQALVSSPSRGQAVPSGVSEGCPNGGLGCPGVLPDQVPFDFRWGYTNAHHKFMLIDAVMQPIDTRTRAKGRRRVVQTGSANWQVGSYPGIAAETWLVTVDLGTLYVQFADQWRWLCQVESWGNTNPASRLSCPFPITDN